MPRLASKPIVNNRFIVVAPAPDVRLCLEYLWGAIKPKSRAAFLEALAREAIEARGGALTSETVVESYGDGPPRPVTVRTFTPPPTKETV